MNRTIVVSIGLNVGEVEPENQFFRTERALASLANSRGWMQQPQLYLGESHWRGAPERFIQVRFVLANSNYINPIAAMAHSLKQECIAVSVNGHPWELIYADGRHVPNSGTFEQYPLYV